MRPLSSFRSRTKPYKATPDSKPTRNSNANCSELVFLCKERITRILAPTPPAFGIDPTGTKLRGVSETLSLNQKFRIRLYILSAWPRPLVVRVHANASIRVVVDTIRSRKQEGWGTPISVTLTELQKNLISPFAEGSRPCEDCAPEGPDGVEAKTGRLDGLSPTSLSARRISIARGADVPPSVVIRALVPRIPQCQTIG